MPKFKLKWSESVIQYWEKEVEAESIEEAQNIYYDGSLFTGDEELVETTFLESELDCAEPICEHSFVDEDNDGNEVCRMCGEDKNEKEDEYTTYSCDECGRELNAEDYQKGEGLCSICVDEIN